MSNDNFIRIDDDYKVYSTKHFNIPRHYEDSIESVLIPHGMVIDRIERMARDIHEGFDSESITILCILKGGFQFCQDLMHCIKKLNSCSTKSIQLGLDFLRVKSYTNESSGDVSISGNDDLNQLKGKNVLIVEDIIDTGKTMKKLLTTLTKYEPKSLKVATLLVKRREDSTGYRPDYIGFEIPHKFVIGYALDYNEYFRDLDAICVINEYGKKKYMK